MKIIKVNEKGNNRFVFENKEGKKKNKGKVINKEKKK